MEQIGLDLIIEDDNSEDFPDDLYNTLVFMSNKLRDKREYFMKIKFEIDDAADLNDALEKFVNIFCHALRNTAYSEVKEDDFCFLNTKQITPMKFEAEVQISNIFGLNDINSFLENTKTELDHKFSTMPEIVIDKLKQFYPISHLKLAKPDIKYETKTEELVNCGDWAYFTPGGWTQYPLKSEI